MIQLESLSLQKVFVLLSIFGAGFAVFAVVVRLLEVETENTAASKKLPWVAKTKGLFWKTKVGFRFMGSYRKYLQEAYDIYLSKGQSCMVKNLNETVTLLLPPEKAQWIADQPQTVLNSRESLRQVLKMDYTFPDPELAAHPAHVDVIKQGLNRNMLAVSPGIIDEMSLAFDEVWGTDTEGWKDVGVFDTLLQVITRTANRALVGLPLCRDKEFIESAIGFSGVVLPTAAFIAFFPNFLKPVIGRIVGMWPKSHYRRLVNRVMPMVKERLALVEKIGSDWEKTAPNDYITWQISYAIRHDDPAERTADRICYRIVVVNFASIYTTNFIATNAVFNIVASPPSFGTLAGLEEEVDRVLKEHGSLSNAALTDMHRINSAVRETLRHSDFANLSQRRVAVSKTMMDDIEIEAGQSLGVPSRPVHMDSKIYPDPYTFDAFRFSREVEEKEAQVKNSPSQETDEKDLTSLHNRLDATRTSETYMTFGHGRFACPGRFLATKELKLILVNMVSKYEIQPLKSRTENWMFGQMCIPPVKDTIRIRRRKDRSLA